MRFTFETSFYGLISTSGHIFLIYSIDIPRLAPLRPRPRPRVSFDILLDRPSRFVTRWIFNTIAAHRRETPKFQKKKNVSP